MRGYQEFFHPLQRFVRSRHQADMHGPQGGVADFLGIRLASACFT